MRKLDLQFAMDRLAAEEELREKGPAMHPERLYRAMTAAGVPEPEARRAAVARARDWTG